MSLGTKPANPIFVPLAARASQSPASPPHRRRPKPPARHRPRVEAQQPMLVKMLTPDPDVVVYWIVD